MPYVQFELAQWANITVKILKFYIPIRMDMEQQTGSKSGKEYIIAVYCHPAYFTDMQSTSWKMMGWGKHKLESRCQEKYQ